VLVPSGAAWVPPLLATTRSLTSLYKRV